MYGIYLYSSSNKNLGGVEKKIREQIEVLSHKYRVESVIIKKEKASVLRKVLWRLPFGSWGADYASALEEIETIASDESPLFFYIRRMNFDRRFVMFLRNLRGKYKSAKILLEVPTYPYYKELICDKTMWPWVIKDLIYRNEIGKYVDRIVTFSDDDDIYGVPTIKLQNGIIVDKIQPKYTEKHCGSEIHLVAVAQFQKSHGYERIIESLYKYYKMNCKYNIILHMVGEGKELRYYKRLVKKFELGEKVIFHGFKTGEELEKIYKISDIALGSFGGYKINQYKSSALKIREYLAYGLPIVSGMREDAFLTISESEFYMELPNDASSIDMYDIVAFYIMLTGKYSKYELRTLIHDYAKKNNDMSVTMKPIVEYVGV